MRACSGSPRSKRMRGLASAPKLVGQFYGTDLTVFKVMFTAILVALLGSFWLARMDVLEAERRERAATGGGRDE